MDHKEAEGYYSFLSMIFVEEWFARTIGVAFFAWVSVVVIRAMLYGGNVMTEARKEKIKNETKKYYVPLNFLWSLIIALKYYSTKTKIGETYEHVLDHIYWYLIFSFVAYGLHETWVKGIAPWSDKRMGTNWLGKKK